MNQIIISHNNYLVKQFFKEKKNNICKNYLDEYMNICLTNHCNSKKCLNKFKKYVKCFIN